jgi:hypothetical protein
MRQERPPHGGSGPTISKERWKVMDRPVEAKADGKERVNSAFKDRARHGKSKYWVNGVEYWSGHDCKFGCDCRMPELAGYLLMETPRPPPVGMSSPRCPYKCPYWDTYKYCNHWECALTLCTTLSCKTFGRICHHTWERYLWDCARFKWKPTYPNYWEAEKATDAEEMERLWSSNTSHVLDPKLGQPPRVKVDSNVQTSSGDVPNLEPVSTLHQDRKVEVFDEEDTKHVQKDGTLRKPQHEHRLFSSIEEPYDSSDDSDVEVMAPPVKSDDTYSDVLSLDLDLGDSVRVAKYTYVPALSGTVVQSISKTGVETDINVEADSDWDTWNDAATSTDGWLSQKYDLLRGGGDYEPWKACFVADAQWRQVNRPHSKKLRKYTDAPTQLQQASSAGMHFRYTFDVRRKFYFYRTYVYHDWTCIQHDSESWRVEYVSDVRHLSQRIVPPKCGPGLAVWDYVVNKRRGFGLRNRTMRRDVMEDLIPKDPIGVGLPTDYFEHKHQVHHLLLVCMPMFHHVVGVVNPTLDEKLLFERVVSVAMSFIWTNLDLTKLAYIRFNTIQLAFDYLRFLLATAPGDFPLTRDAGVSTSMDTELAKFHYLRSARLGTGR